MKVDGLGVVLAIILLPIILVVTYFIHMQVDTIVMENQYNSKLLSATYDAMTAFEINTANEKLSSVSDSMRSIILASNNVFIDSLADNMGIPNASKELIRPYIPAVLYTMYDGYYIYAPTVTAKVAEKKEETISEDEKLITTKGQLSVGDKGVTHISGNHYAYDQTSENISLNPTADGTDFGAILYEVNGQNYLTIDQQEAMDSERNAENRNLDYLLKSYMQYSGRYVRDDQIDVTINYTLDNYLNIIGTIGDVYYTKTGYLIKKDLVTDVQINEASYDLMTNNETDAKNRILGLKTNAKETTINAANKASVTVDGVTITAEFDKIAPILKWRCGADVTTISEAERYLEKEWTEQGSADSSLTEVAYEIKKYKAIAYYTSSAIFSNWVYENLGDLTYADIKDDAMREFYLNNDEAGNANPIYNPTSSLGADDLYFNFQNNAVKDRPIFDDEEDPENLESNFNTHKIEVIKNSIKYNLNLAISSYASLQPSYDFSLPILLDEEWDKVLSNISIVTFLQGLDCGLNIYNNYQIVSSTNNELMVTPDDIYFVKLFEFDRGDGCYHRIDCPYLDEIWYGMWIDHPKAYMSFKSKEVKYDKVYDKASSKYHYDHKNLACYTCINNSNYQSLFTTDSTSYYDKINSLGSTMKKEAGCVAIASERQNIYKTNALPISEGYQTVDKDVLVENEKTMNIGDYKANTVKKLQITISNTKSVLPENSQIAKETIARLKITVGGKIFENQAINLDQTKEQTIYLDMADSSEKITDIIFEKTTPDITGYNIKYIVESIKVVYK